LACGGEDSSGGTLNTCELHMPGNASIAGPTMQHVRKRHAMIVDEKGAIWAIGGTSPGVSCRIGSFFFLEVQI